MKTLLLILLLAAPAWAAQIEDYLATEPITVDHMIGLARVVPGDVVYDLGSGDGRIVVAAAKRGAYAVGIELDSKLVAASRRNIKGLNAAILERDMFEVNLKPATVIMVFFGKEALAKLSPKLEGVRPGTRIVSNGLPIPGFSPKEVADVGQILCVDPVKKINCWHAPLYLYEIR